MTLDDVAAAVTALGGVRETECDGLRRWYVTNRLVARQLDRDSVVVRTAFDAREELLDAHPRTFSVPPRFEKHMMVVVELPQADAAAVRRSLRAAWELQRRN